MRRQALRANLVKGKKLTEQEVSQLPYKYWKERCRRIIPTAGDIVPALDLMMQKKWVDETGVSLITDATADAHRAALRIINSGRLSVVTWAWSQTIIIEVLGIGSKCAPWTLMHPLALVVPLGPLQGRLLL
ncbi:hypothetical protein WJX75_003249 [Coccomyxa subellipsoidea]|uniref:Uncharacterized protein n=1 Tax=Coccomyxa subellipsoidea TaxID=248742 RepID=A0ABR2YAX3_9CHLO